MPIDAGEIIPLEPRHLAGAQALSDAAHWNQVNADWSMMLAAGAAIGIEDRAGTLIASALTLPFGDRFGWISMVLVAPASRKQGLATRLMEACIEQLQDQRLAPVLDATPLGEPLYRQLGFVPVLGYQRWQHDSIEDIDLNGAPQSGLVPAAADTVKAIDARVFGGERPIILADLVRRSGVFSCMTAAGDGYLLGRDGRVATQIGPVSAADTQSAMAMLDHALARITGPAFIDASDQQPEFVDKLKAYGFRPQRPFTRMAVGLKESPGSPAQMFAMAGPELG